ncbi:hypothetical protein SRABI89_04983 [Pseudomonas koreensis]|nr:hypothetical protein SRABI89_04983 [Pseudomonas koreensis]
MASRSVVINFSSPALAVPPPSTPGVKVSHRPIIDDDGSEIVRAPVSTDVVVTPWKKLIRVSLQKRKSPAMSEAVRVLVIRVTEWKTPRQ